MNNLLLINRKLILIIFFIISLFIIIFYTVKEGPFNKNLIDIKKEDYSFDIKNPKFTINGRDEEISIKAKGASFINTNEILLEKNVIFKSNKFKIYTDNVVFNKKTLVASTQNKSKFISDNTSIDSAGFDIIENGNIINFKGKTKLVLK